MHLQTVSPVLGTVQVLSTGRGERESSGGGGGGLTAQDPGGRSQGWGGRRAGGPPPPAQPSDSDMMQHSGIMI